MPKLIAGKALSKSIEQFAEDNRIHSCSMHGPVHYSFCVYCPDFTGKEQLGNKSGRKPSHCRLSGRHLLGSVNGDEIDFANAAHLKDWLDEEDKLGKYVPEARRASLDETDIKSAFNTDVPMWDWMRHSHYFCFRCGPEGLGEIMYRCQTCGERNICDACGENFNYDTEPDGSRTASFKCPTCHEKNELNLGIDDVGAARFADNVPERRLKWTNSRFVPVLFEWLDQRIRAGYAKRCTMSVDLEAPSASAVKFQLSGNWLSGEFWIDSNARKAWMESGEGDWQDTLYSRVPHGLNLNGFDYDLVLSYRSEVLAYALEVRRKITDAGLSVFLMEAARNQWDHLWPLRFSQASCRAKFHVVLATKNFFEGTATRAELWELEIQCNIRRALMPEVEWKVWGIYLKDQDEFIYASNNPKVTMVELQQFLMEVAFKDFDCAALFPIRKVGIPNFREFATKRTCPTCSGNVYFDDDVKSLNMEQCTEFTKDKNLALSCVHGHRYCSGCDASQFESGNRHCCPTCYQQKLGAHLNVAGKRTIREIYYSGIYTGPGLGLHGFDSGNPECPNCGSSIYTNGLRGKSCFYGHRFCSSCGPAECPICSAEAPGTESESIFLSLNAYFYLCLDNAPIKAHTINSGECDWCGSEKENESFVRFKQMGLACEKCLTCVANNFDLGSSEIDLNQWSEFREKLNEGNRCKFKEPTCLCCEQATLALQAGRHQGYVIRSFWAICKECSDRANSLLHPVSRERT